MPWLLLPVVCMFSGCHPARNVFPSRPTIQFVTVPLAEPGDPNTLRVISGTVTGARPEERIVLYARTETTWWVQPYADQPFTAIHADATWRSTTHPGVEYAALVVGPGFRPPLKSEVLPKDGVIAVAITRGTPPLWGRWWFLIACLLAVLSIVIAMHRYRMKQMAYALNLGFEERLDERMRIAQLLHDTFLQDVISASMQLHVAVSQLPADSPAVGSVNSVLRTMSHTIDEGRNTLRGMRSPKERLHDLVESLSTIPRELDAPQDIRFSVTVKGRSLPLRPKIYAGVYHIAREALAVAFRQPGVANIEVKIQHTTRDFRFSIRYKCIKRPCNATDGVAEMREQAEAIGAKLKLRNRLWRQTALELRIPSDVAFESYRFPAASE